MSPPPSGAGNLMEYKFEYKNNYIINLNDETLYVSYYRYQDNYWNQTLLPNKATPMSGAYNFSCFRKVDDNYQFIFAVVDGTINGYYSTIGLDENGEVKENKFVSGNFSYYIKE